jgi:hypothetical protein
MAPALPRQAQRRKPARDARLGVEQPQGLTQAATKDDLAPEVFS